MDMEEDEKLARELQEEEDHEMAKSLAEPADAKESGDDDKEEDKIDEIVDPAEKDAKVAVHE